ncbi:hypothetical protein, partial [Arcticibacter svalbardensis]|uniref:hypothetical protein n=1 Tax=Arcticibacter svalbardensis TaxID=1288027 RepID=UPI00058E59FB
ISNLSDPTNDQDATTKKYVDSKSGSVPSGTTPPSSPSAGNTFITQQIGSIMSMMALNGFL